MFALCKEFCNASNLLWRLGQPNSDLVGLITNLVRLTLIFGLTNQKMMRVEATKFLVSAIKFGSAGQKIGNADSKFGSSNQKFRSANQKWRSAQSKFYVPNRYLVVPTLTKGSKRLQNFYECIRFLEDFPYERNIFLFSSDYTYHRRYIKFH